MEIIDSCPVCGSNRLHQYQATVSDFLADRVWGRKPWPVRLCRCRRCGMVFYDLRMDSEEMGRLYHGYRDPEYQAQRQRYEPEYTAEINASLGGEEEARERRRLLQKLLEEERVLSDIRSVLDYGGDRGQCIVDAPSIIERFVFDISGASPEKGVVAIPSLDECRSRTYDLVMCCHTLEHVSDPVTELQTIASLAAPEGLVYVELPFDTPFPHRPRTLGQAILSMLSRFPVALDMLGRVRGVRFVMHEHVNHFDEPSLRYLLDVSGLEVVYMDIKEAVIPRSNILLLRCLARRRPSSYHDLPELAYLQGQVPPVLH